MGECQDGMTIHRIHNDFGYYPKNCKWETVLEQNRHSRHNHTVTVGGFTGCLTAACEHFGVNYFMVRTRLSLGWPVERAFFEPKH